MNNPDDYDYYADLAKIGQEALHDASLRHGGKPSQGLSRKELISLQVNIARQYEDTILSSGVWINYITHKSPPSTASFWDLRAMYAQDLRLERIHKDRSIILRTVAFPTGVTGILTVAEDEHGNCELVHLPILDLDRTQISEDFFSKGQVFIVKEPFYTSNASGELEIGTSIRVDHISDVLLLRPGDARIPPQWQKHRSHRLGKTATDWMKEGNKLYEDGEFHKAVECYTGGLEIADIKNLRSYPTITNNMRLGRALAHFRLSQGTTEFHDMVMEDVCSVLRQDPGNEKALFFGAKALYGARKFKDCNDYLAKLVLKYNGLSDKTAKIDQIKRVSSEIFKVYRRIEEERTGQYNFQELRRLTSSLKPNQGPVKLDCADFTGPVEFRRATNSERGLFATRDVNFGELLLFTKAIHTYYPETSEKSVVIDLTTGRLFESNGRDFSVSDIARGIYNNPSTAGVFMPFLGAGDETQSTQVVFVDGKPVINTFHIRDFQEHNSFVSPLHSTATDFFLVHGDIVLEGEEEKNSIGFGIGLSPIGHACWNQSTARRSTIGDMIIIRATKNIKKGEQITLQHDHVQLRPSSLASSYSQRFLCKCQLCEAESAEPPAIRDCRSKLLEVLMTYGQLLAEDYETLFNVSGDILKSVESLEATYTNPPSQQPRYALVAALQFLLRSYSCREEEGLSSTVEMIETVKRILGALGYEIEESLDQRKVLIKKHGCFPSQADLSECLAQCSKAYRIRGEHVMAQAWQELAIDFHEVDFGEGFSFVERFKESFERVGFQFSHVSEEPGGVVL